VAAPCSLRLTVHDTDSGHVLAKESFSVEANGITTAGSLPAVTHPALWQISWQLDGTFTVGLNHYLAGSRPFSLQQYRQWMVALNIPAEIGPTHQNQ
jgi:hypothetical protein